MPSDLFEQIPGWLKSLWHMETELRDAARSGVTLQKDAALAHLAESRRHLDEAMKSARPGTGTAGEQPPTPPTPPVRKDGEF